MTSSEPIVYVVDDDTGLRKSLRWLIESVGLKVEAYASGGEFSWIPTKSLLISSLLISGGAILIASFRSDQVKAVRKALARRLARLTWPTAPPSHRSPCSTQMSQGWFVSVRA